MSRSPRLSGGGRRANVWGGTGGGMAGPRIAWVSVRTPSARC